MNRQFVVYLKSMLKGVVKRSKKESLSKQKSRDCLKEHQKKEPANPQRHRIINDKEPENVQRHRVIK
jgi:hypothetical protein